MKQIQHSELSCLFGYSFVLSGDINIIIIYGARPCCKSTGHLHRPADNGACHYTHERTHTHTHTHTHSHSLTHTDIDTHIHTQTDAHTRTHARTHAHTLQMHALLVIFWQKGEERNDKSV